MKTISFANKPKAFWSQNEEESWSDENQSEIPTEDDEVSAFITDEVHKNFQRSDLFISDTGYTNDMTDKPYLFTSELTQIPRRWIKVGGGRLFSDYKGDVLLRCPDSSSGILHDVLLVEGLGVNLLSAKRFCERSNAKGSFDNKKMLFHDKNDNLILSASLENGLYKVDHISGPSERALISQDHNHDYLPIDIDEAQDGETTDHNMPLRSRAEVLEQRRLERYWLHHRRCGHAGPRVISLLHTITDVDRPIKIPSNLELFDVCLTTKMKKYRS